MASGKKTVKNRAAAAAALTWQFWLKCHNHVTVGGWVSTTSLKFFERQQTAVVIRAPRDLLRHFSVVVRSHTRNFSRILTPRVTKYARVITPSLTPRSLNFSVFSFVFFVVRGVVLEKVNE